MAGHIDDELRPAGSLVLVACIALTSGCQSDDSGQGDDWARQAREWTLRVDEDARTLHAIDTRLGYGFVERDYRAARDATRALLRLAGCEFELDRMGKPPTRDLRDVESRLRTACGLLERGAISDLEEMPRAATQNPFGAGIFELAAGQQIAEQARTTLDDLAD